MHHYYVYGIIIEWHCYLGTSKTGFSIEITKDNTVVRYHQAPGEPPASELENNDTTICSGTVAYCAS